MTGPQKKSASPSAPPPTVRIIRLSRLIYEAAQAKVYAGLAGEGFPEIRPAHSAVFRNIEPQGTRASDLAERAGITKQSVAYLIDSLQADGLAESIPDPDDGRARLIRLTARGQTALATLNRLSDAVEARILAGLTETRREALRQDLSEIVRKLTD